MAGMEGQTINRLALPMPLNVHTIDHIVDVLDTHSTEYKRHAIPTAYPAAAVVQSHSKPIPIHPFVHLQRQLDVLINSNLSDIS